jgi:hypothetical protein
MAAGGNTAMTLTLEITPDLEAALRQTAEREGLPPDRYVLNLLRERLHRNQTAPPRLPREEVKLLEKINEGLAAETWQRYHELKAKRDAATLTPEEHAELIALSDTIEAWNVRRLEFVAELARLREVPFPELVRQLGLVPAADA